MKKILSLLVLMGFFVSALPALSSNVPWANDLRTLFLSNRAVILAINIRTFNAQDTNDNDIIEFDKGEKSGNFINAIDRLDEIKALGFNTVHLLPITPVGKIKAIGTAGSLYAMSDFAELNPQLGDLPNALSLEEQARKFINECHKRNIRVIVDLPCCGSYDLYLTKPNLFLTEKDQSVVPSDWTDVRLFKVQNKDGSLNKEVYEQYKNYIDMVMRLNVDGIRADVASSKPYEFWNQLIKYAQSKDPQFLFLAEASESWSTPVTKGAPFTPYDKLLSAGFDGYYGSFMNFKDWKSVSQLEEQIKTIKAIKTKFNTPKAVIGSFATHDEVSPMLIGSVKYSTMLVWLQATLPVNTYFTDGFQTGDPYTYQYANQKAPKTYTDDNYYYVHKGKIDIFNFSRRPGGNIPYISQELSMANNIKAAQAELVSNGAFDILKTTNPSIFAYSRTLNDTKIVVIINKDLAHENSGTVKCKGIRRDLLVLPLKQISPPKAGKNEFKVALTPGETIVLAVNMVHEAE